MVDLDDKKRKLATILKWVGGLFGAAILAPVAFMALKGVVAFGLALLVAGIIAVGVTQVAPTLSFILSNWMLKIIKWEARTNPIETLQNQLQGKAGMLQTMKMKITDFDTNVRQFESKTKGFKEKYPGDSSFDEQLLQMKAVLVEQRRIYHLADLAVQRFASEIDRARAKWDVALAAKGAFKSMGKFAGTVMDNIKRETALESVELEMNRAFAELTSTLDQGIPELPAHTTPVTIDVSPMRENARLA